MLDEEARRKRRLTSAQWLEIVALAKTGLPTSEICERFSISKTAFYSGLERRGYSRATLKKNQQQYSAEKDRHELVENIRATRRDSFKRVEAMERMAVSTIAKASQNGHPLSSVAGDIKVIERVMNIVTRGTNAKWKILGLDRENANADETMPELIVRELTSEEIMHIREEQKRGSNDVTEEEMKMLEQDIDSPTTIIDMGEEDDEDGTLDEIVSEELRS